MRINHQQPVSGQLREIIRESEKSGMPFEIKFIKIETNGFYKYRIKHKGQDIIFFMEPSLVPAYEFVKDDMLIRHRANPRESIIENPNMKTPFTDIDEAVKRIKRVVDEIDQRRHK